MCYIDSRCRVQRHRRPENCPYYRGPGSTPRRSSSSFPSGHLRPSPSPIPPGHLRSSSTSTTATPSSSSSPRLSGGRYTRTAAGDGISLADLLILIVVAKSWDRFHAVAGTWGYAVVAVLVVLPFIVAAWLSRHCTAWNGTVEGRCAKVRDRPFERCEVPTHSHGAQLVTAHEVGAVVACLAGLAGVWALFAV